MCFIYSVFGSNRSDCSPFVYHLFGQQQTEEMFESEMYRQPMDYPYIIDEGQNGEFQC